MKINATFFRNKIISLNDSIFYPILLALFSFCIWLVPSPYNIIFGVLYCLFAFVPLIDKEGRNYLPLLLFLIPASSKEINVSSIPLLSFFIIGSILLSMVLKIIIYKMPLRRGDLSLPLLGTVIIFLISFIFNIISRNDSSSTIAVLYIVGFLLLILVYVFLSTILGQSNMMMFLSKCIIMLSYVIILELLVYLIRNNFASLENVALGWSQSNGISTILCFSIPFYAIIINNRKYWYYIFLLIPILFSIVILVVDSGILFLITLLIPLLLITYKSYGKIYPYISLFIVASFVISFAVLLVFNEVFTNQIFDVFRNISFTPNSNIRIHFDDYKMIDLFTSNIVLGSSISSIYIGEDFIFANNTIVSTLVLGGIVGLVFYLIYELDLYIIWARKKADIKYIFLMFLLAVEVIGIIDNVIYNFMNMLFILTCNACYHNSSRPDDVPIHNDFFVRKNQITMERSKSDTFIEL